MGDAISGEKQQSGNRNKKLAHYLGLDFSLRPRAIYALKQGVLPVAGLRHR
jgi:hypothetical protein